MCHISCHVPFLPTLFCCFFPVFFCPVVFLSYVMPCALLAHIILLSFSPVVFLICCLSVVVGFWVTYLSQHMSCIMPCVICHAMCPTCPHYSVVFLFCFLSVILLSIILIIMICDIMMLFLNNSTSVTSTPAARDAIASKKTDLKKVSVKSY